MSHKKLTAFVTRGMSDSNIVYNAEASKHSAPAPEPRASTPNVVSGYKPTRHEIAEFVKLPLPSATRAVVGSTLTLAGPKAPRIASPTMRYQAAPAGQTKYAPSEHGDGLFSGSQLGEGFMNSGLSTPRIEHEAVEVDRTPDAKVANRRSNRGVAFPATSYHGAGESDSHKFHINENGRLSVVPGRSQPRPTYLNDGFYDEGTYRTKGRASKAYPKERIPLEPNGQARLPVRAAHSRDHKHESNALASQAKKDEGREDLAEAANEEWQDAVAEERVSDSNSLEDSGDDLHAYVEQEQRPRPWHDSGRGGVSKTKSNGLVGQLETVRGTKNKTSKRRHAALDYDDTALAGMSFKDLQDEPFDLSPAEGTLDDVGSSAPATLKQRLDHYRQKRDGDQRSLFSKMSVEEWEESGDWFVEQFAGVMNRLKEARREKRQTIREFEMEAAEREEAIRTQTELIDEKLVKMRQDGQRVVGK